MRIVISMNKKMRHNCDLLSLMGHKKEQVDNNHCIWHSNYRSHPTHLFFLL